MTPANLLDLIGRLEAATGPDRELDADIWMLFDPQAANGAMQLGIAFSNRDWTQEEKQRKGRDRLKRQSMAYTASIDAALTLVPDCPSDKRKDFKSNWWWTIEAFAGSKGSGKDGYLSRVYNADETNTFGTASTAPIALCIAALKARLP